MPSNQLAELCAQIEKQDTDHFGKFYMYVSLLNTITVRNKIFTDGLPKYSRGIALWRDNHLNIGGDLPVDFNQKLNKYAGEFINTQPHYSNAAYNIVMAYCRRGKITDLAYIIDQMLNHLALIHGQLSHNRNIYDYINFSDNKEGLVKFIKQVSDFNHQILSIADGGCNTALSLLAVTLGLVLVLASISSIVPLIIGLPLVLGGAFGTYNFVTRTIAQLEGLEKQMNNIVKTMEGLPQNVTLFGNKNYNSFYAAVVKPLPYAAITAAEQLTCDESQQNELKRQRDTLDKVSIALSV